MVQFVFLPVLGILVLIRRGSYDALLLSCLSFFIYLLLVFSYYLISCASTKQAFLILQRQPTVDSSCLSTCCFLLSLLSHLQVHALHIYCLATFSSHLCLYPGSFNQDFHCLFPCKVIRLILPFSLFLIVFEVIY